MTRHFLTMFNPLS